MRENLVGGVFFEILLLPTISHNLPKPASQQKCFLLAGCTLALNLTACNTTEKEVVFITAPSEANYMTQAAQGDLAAIQAGMLAGSKGMETSVRDFGNQMMPITEWPRVIYKILRTV